MNPCSPRYIATLLLPLFFASACNGQGNNQIKTHQANIGKNNSVQLKMRKTQGANEYQNVHCGLQDIAGNLWFGTTGEGVYRYDGKLFTQYTVKDGLSSNTVWSILEDTKGNIWLGTDAGVCLYDGKTIKAVSNDPAYQKSAYPGAPSSIVPSVNNAVWSMMQDSKGTIWLGTDSGMYCYNGTTYVRFLETPGITNKMGVTLKSIQCMLEDSKGNIWFGSGPMAFEGICRYDGKTLVQYKPNNETWVRNIKEAKNGDVFFATRHYGVCRYNGAAFEYISTPQGMVKGSMMSSLEDRSGNQWFASDYGAALNDTFGGVWRYDGRSYTKYSTKDGLKDNSVFLILQDRAGNIWVGTRNIGLYRFNGKTFDSYSE